MRAQILSSVILLLLLLWTVPALAQTPSPATQGAANALFEEGIKLRNKGLHKRACEKFEASQKLDAARGTLYNIGLCLEKQGKVASSLNAFQELLDQAESANDKDRILAARTYIKRLKKRVPTLKLLAPKNVPEEMRVSTGRGPIPLALLGLNTPMDPGEYSIRVEAPGYKTRLYSVKLKERDVQTLQLKRLKKQKVVSDSKADKENVDPSKESLTKAADKVDTGHFALSLGASHLFEEGHDSLAGAIEASVAFRVGRGSNFAELGLSAAFARHSWGFNTDMLTTQAHAAFVHAFSPGWAVRLRTGLGAMVLYGLDQPGHPWVDPSVEATGAIVLLQGSLQAGVVRRLSESISLQWIPAQMSLSLGRSGLAENVGEVLSVRSLVSLEYHY